jgi:hypothetical protein
MIGTSLEEHFEDKKVKLSPWRASGPMGLEGPWGERKVIISHRWETS